MRPNLPLSLFPPSVSLSLSFSLFPHQHYIDKQCVKWSSLIASGLIHLIMLKHSSARWQQMVLRSESKWKPKEDVAAQNTPNDTVDQVARTGINCRLRDADRKRIIHPSASPSPRSLANYTSLKGNHFLTLKWMKSGILRFFCARERKTIYIIVRVSSFHCIHLLARFEIVRKTYKEIASAGQFLVYVRPNDCNLHNLICLNMSKDFCVLKST